MTNLLQTSLAAATANAADDLAEAFGTLPSDKRLWGSSWGTRPALLLVTESILLVGEVADAIRTGQGRDWQKWPDGAGQWDNFRQGVADAAALGWDDYLRELLWKNGASAASAVAAVPEETLGSRAEWPWGGTSAVTEMITYPLLTMRSCSAKISLIASLRGTLE